MPKFNPFRPGSIVTPGMFRGRVEELNAIEAALYQTQNGNPQHFLIEGERGIGKSSLMLFVERVATGKVTTSDNLTMNFIVLSLELDSKNSEFDIVRKIAAELRREIDEREKLKAMARSAWEFISSWEILGVKYAKASSTTDIDPIEVSNQLVKVIEEILKTRQVSGVLILLDEADKPPVEADLGTFLKLFTERLTKRDCQNICLGLAGLPDLVQKLKDSHESSPRLFNILTLAPLTEDERKSVVVSGLDEANSKNEVKTAIDGDALEVISVLSEGYPHFIQQFAYCAFEKDDDYKISKDDVVNGAFQDNGALHQLGHKYFASAYFDQIGSDNYRKVLQTMANKMDSWMTRKEIIIHSGLNETTVSNALKALKERGIIIPSDATAGKYRLPTKSFAVWIKAVAMENNGKLRI